MPSPQQNEIARENQFYTWTPGLHNMAGLLVMCVVFPMGFHYLNKHEMELRDVRLDKHDKPQARL